MNDETGRAQRPCPVTYALELFGDRWTLLVLRDLMLEGRHRYRELLAANPGLATNVLADRLKRLERRGLVSKTRDEADARQFIYRPTDAAVDLVPMLLEMIVWSVRQGEAAVDPGFLQRFEDDKEALVAAVKQQVREQAELG